jgi:hypothetical protein
MACLEALLGRVGEGEVAEVAVRAALRILSHWLAFIHQRLKVLGTPTRAVTASSSFSTSTSSRFLFCCEACFLTLVGRVRPVIPGATISAHSREFGCTGKLCRIASQRNFGGDGGPCTFAAGVSLTDALRFGSFNSPDRRTPQQPLFRLHICSAAVAYHFAGTFLCIRRAISITSLLSRTSPGSTYYRIEPQNGRYRGRARSSWQGARQGESYIYLRTCT